MDNFIPHQNYDALRKQAYALNTINESLQAQIAFYREQDYRLRQKRLDELRSSLDSEKAMNETLTNENESLRAQLAECQKDAERYRWLRGMIYDDRIMVENDRMLHGKELDKAIDKAMSEKG
jgi:predicted RNase H-like nuclease (RuvC/YqgF family)